MSVPPDERQPLLRNVDSNLQPGGHSNEVDDIATKWHLTGDPDNPLDWSRSYKWGIVLLLACTALITSFTCLSIVPVAGSIIKDLDKQESKTASVLLVTTWELGEATGPFLIAPLSELFGRRPVMNACNIGLVACTTLASFANSGALMIVTRYLSGMSVAVNVLNPAILGDMLDADQLGTAMSLIILAPLLGGAIGPVVGGVLAAHWGWRRMLRICAAGVALCEVFFFTIFQETYKPIIVKQKLCKEARDQTLETSLPRGNDTQRRPLVDCLVRPFAILWSSSVLQAMSLFCSVAFAYYYIILTTLPAIMRHSFHRTEAQTSFAFIPLSVGDLVSVIICNQLVDRIYIRLRRRKSENTGEPEYRLPLAVVGGCLLPFAIASFGWASYVSIIVIRLVLVLLGLSIIMSSIPAMSYVVDAFGQYSASAIMAAIVTRALLGALLPLVIEPMVLRLDFGLTFTIWGVFSMCIMPVPILCMRYGHNWRQRSKYTRPS